MHPSCCCTEWGQDRCSIHTIFPSSMHRVSRVLRPRLHAKVLQIHQILDSSLRPISISAAAFGRPGKKRVRGSKTETQAKRGTGRTDEDTWQKIQEIERGLVKEYKEHGLQPMLKPDAAGPAPDEVALAKARGQELGLGEGRSFAAQLLRRHPSVDPQASSSNSHVASHSIDVPHDGRGTFGEMSSGEEDDLSAQGYRDVPAHMLAKLLGDAPRDPSAPSDSDSDIDEAALAQLLSGQQPGHASSPPPTPPSGGPKAHRGGSTFEDMLRTLAMEQSGKPAEQRGGAAAPPLFSRRPPLPPQGPAPPPPAIDNRHSCPLKAPAISQCRSPRGAPPRRTPPPSPATRSRR